MKQQSLLVTLTSIFFLTLSSCAAVGGLMKLSFWTGAIIVIVIVALIIFVVSRMGNKS